MRTNLLRTSAVVALLAVTATGASADYAVELTEHRRLLGWSWWEEGDVVRLSGPGGVVGLPRAEILSIREVPPTLRPRSVVPDVPGPDAASPGNAGGRRPEGSAPPDDRSAAAATQTPGDATGTDGGDAGEPMTDEERRAALERRQQALDRAVLEAQRDRFEAEARGDDAEQVERLQKEFERLQGERRQVMQELRRLGGGQ
jgi:hypothetical protein